MSVHILTGDVRERLADLPDQSIQCVVTSPPYFGLRSYLTAGHPDKVLEIGAEETADDYVANLVDVFRCVWRVLRDDGCLLLNIGDSYNAYNANRGPSRSISANTNEVIPDARRGLTAPALKNKDLIGIPWMLAFALRADRWYLRGDYIWHKPAPMPESVRDRCTSSHEHVFHLTKRPRYYWDADAIAETSVSDHPSGNGFKRDARQTYRDERGARGNNKQWSDVGGTRNRRDVWTIATKPFPEGHFATMPPELAELCIKAGSSEAGCCPRCGSPLARIIEKGAADLDRQRICGGNSSGEYYGQSRKGHAAAGVQDASAVKARILAGMVQKRTVGWHPTCGCGLHQPRPCVVLDPFAGAGTTLLVADRLGRDSIGIELNPEYAAMAKQRIRKDAGLFAEVV